MWGWQGPSFSKISYIVWTNYINEWARLDHDNILCKCIIAVLIDRCTSRNIVDNYGSSQKARCLSTLCNQAHQLWVVNLFQNLRIFTGAHSFRFRKLLTFIKVHKVLFKLGYLAKLRILENSGTSRGPTLGYIEEASSSLLEPLGFWTHALWMGALFMNVSSGFSIFRGESFHFHGFVKEMRTVIP